jgi:single-strand DNA-binding protein
LVWHRLTEIIGQYLKKGNKAYFEGKLRTNEYEKDGIKRYSTEIVVNDMVMLDSLPSDGQMGQGNSNKGGAPQPSQMQPGNQMNNQGFQQQPEKQLGYQSLQQSRANNFDSFDDDISF